jgi:hypothetical protein
MNLYTALGYEYLGSCLLQTVGMAQIRTTDKAMNLEQMQLTFIVRRFKIT